MFPEFRKCFVNFSKCFVNLFVFLVHFHLRKNFSGSQLAIYLEFIKYSAGVEKVFKLMETNGN